ncbi:MAG: class I SAM-dependent methyltransferase, partial [Eubacterium sp.]|nr:class I SAM-dependent methyltransferase [Eubacterium sp.]
EAMIDMGEINLAEEAMKKIEAIQKESGAVPAYRNVDWVCSTGLFQLAVVWFRLGNIKSGNKAFSYACKLQNKSGGWFGSYVSEENSNEINTYFPSAEISWVIKYFLDALYYKNKCQFEMQAPMFLEQLTLEDGRYEIVKKAILSSGELQYKVLDVGCGKGRYLKNLATELPANKYFGVDISLTVMKYFEEFTQIEKRQGNLTNIPYEDNYFDIVYTCEALEHAIDITSAIREMVRVTRTGGKIIVIDKNKDMYGYFDIEDWEQWFDKDELKKLMMNYCTDVEYVGDIDYDNQKSNGLFGAWIGTVI